MAAGAGVRPRPGTPAAPRLTEAIGSETLARHEAQLSALEAQAADRGRSVAYFRVWGITMTLLFAGLFAWQLANTIQQGSTNDYLRERRVVADQRADQAEADQRAADAARARDEYLLCAATSLDPRVGDLAASVGLPCDAILAGPTPTMPAR